MSGAQFAWAKFAGETANWDPESEGPNFPGWRQGAWFAGAQFALNPSVKYAQNKEHSFDCRGHDDLNDNEYGPCLHLWDWQLFIEMSSLPKHSKAKILFIKSLNTWTGKCNEISSNLIKINGIHWIQILLVPINLIQIGSTQSMELHRRRNRYKLFFYYVLVKLDTTCTLYIFEKWSW